MQTLSEIRRLLDERGLRPKRSLGQNFLHDHNLIRRLVDASAVGEGDLVLEVGPGTGALTECILARGARVIACEIDDDLAELLGERFAPDIASGRLVLVHADCLDGKHALGGKVADAIGSRPFRLVANLPYGAASPLMVILATARHPATAGAGPCLGQFVTIQKEVADRVRAETGTRDYSELSVMVQAMSRVRRIAALPPGCFWPPPKVTSEMIAIEPRDKPLTNDPAHLERLCRVVFSKRRKQIGPVLQHAGLLGSLPEGVDAASRPEQLSVEQLVAIADRLP